MILLPFPVDAKNPAGGEPSSSGSVSDYVLGVGDKVKITVFGESDLSGEFEVTSTGKVSMTLIGEVDAAGRTLSQLQSTITTKLLDGYMKDPHVSVEVGNYRPFFIVGEVMKPGSYGYVNGMTVINAIAMAGGYTYRADKGDITLRRGGNQGKEEKVEEDGSVHPGDVVSVPERFF
ncbi:MAG: polysaccharide export protein [Proteobacteria bacterium]|nr:polysaccharide export protein [Pseudomonadota bacterium]